MTNEYFPEVENWYRIEDTTGKVSGNNQLVQKWWNDEQNVSLRVIEAIPPFKTVDKKYVVEINDTDGLNYDTIAERKSKQEAIKKAYKKAKKVENREYKND